MYRYVLMAWYLVKLRDNFTSLLIYILNYFIYNNLIVLTHFLYDRFFKKFHSTLM